VRVRRVQAKEQANKNLQTDELRSLLRFRALGSLNDSVELVGMVVAS
jgi:hypothetical protein